jgi:hypothetical protein
MFGVQLALLIYGLGVAVGLMFTDAKPALRVALSLLWPIGPLAFVTVVSGLLLASLIAFPMFGAAVAVIAAAAWMALG